MDRSLRGNYCRLPVAGLASLFSTGVMPAIIAVSWKGNEEQIMAQKSSRPQCEADKPVAETEPAIRTGRRSRCRGESSAGEASFRALFEQAPEALAILDAANII